MGQFFFLNQQLWQTLKKFEKWAYYFEKNP